MERVAYVDIMLAGAAGDAIGYATELLTVNEIREQFGPHGLRAPIPSDPQNESCLISDDTQMTIFTINGIGWAIQREEDIINGLYRAYMRWYYMQTGEEPRYGQKSWLKKQKHEIKNLARDKRLMAHRRPDPACLDALKEPADRSIEEPINKSKGCSGLMRVAPVGMYLRGNPEEAFVKGCESAAITDGHPIAYTAAGAMAACMALLCEGHSLRRTIRTVKKILRTAKADQYVYDAIEAAERQAEVVRKLRPEAREKGDWWYYIKGMRELGKGFRADEALAIALCCALAYTGSRYAVLAAANHDGNTCTSASLCGQLTAADTKHNKIPSVWTENLECEDTIRTLALQLESYAS